MPDQRVSGGAAVEAQGWLWRPGYGTVETAPASRSNPVMSIWSPARSTTSASAIHDDFSATLASTMSSLGYKLGLDNAEAEINAVQAQVMRLPLSALPRWHTAATARLSSGGNNVDDGIDWSKAGERLITLFYPGQASMEWTLVGKYHGGALPFKSGDRCVTCHDTGNRRHG